MVSSQANFDYVHFLFIVTSTKQACLLISQQV